MANYFDGKVARRFINTTIASSGTTSTSIELRGDTVVAVVFPSAMTSKLCYFQASFDNSTFNDMVNIGGAKLALQITVDSWVELTALDIAAPPYIRLVTDTAEGAERTVKIITRSSL